MGANNMDFSTICRTCLRDSDLNPIFISFEDQKRYSAAIYITTGLKVEPNDGLPQQMCTNCLNFLNDSLKFRKQCKENESQLLKQKSDLESAESNITFVEIIHDTQTNSLAKRTRFKMELEVETLKYDENIPDFKHGNLEDSSVEKEVESNLKKESSDSNTDLKIEYLEEKEFIEEYLDENLSEDEVPLKYLVENECFSQQLSDQRSLYIEENECAKRPESFDRHSNNNSTRVDMENRDGKMLRCGYCNTELDSQQGLVGHITTCTAKGSKKKTRSGKELRECDICHKTMQKASLRLHKAIKHAGLGPVCEHCGRRFGNKFRLTEHFRAKHGYDKFRCQRCDFQTSRAVTLQNHERRHLGEKPFVCETCGAKFHAAYLLVQHRQSHRTDKVVKCDLCPATFKANNSLHLHKAACHSQDMVKCHLCARTYSCRHYAVKHLRQVHNFQGPVPDLQRVTQGDSNNPD